MRASNKEFLKHLLTVVVKVLLNVWKYPNSSAKNAKNNSSVFNRIKAKRDQDTCWEGKTSSLGVWIPKDSKQMFQLSFDYFAKVKKPCAKNIEWSKFQSQSNCNPEI